MGKKVSDFVLCFSRGLLTLKLRKSMAYIQTANRTIERSPNMAAIFVAIAQDIAPGRMPHNYTLHAECTAFYGVIIVI